LIKGEYDKLPDLSKNYTQFGTSTLRQAQWPEHFDKLSVRSSDRCTSTSSVTDVDQWLSLPKQRFCKTTPKESHKLLSFVSPFKAFWFINYFDKRRLFNVFNILFAKHKRFFEEANKWIFLLIA
jgi:hypothetical protein